MLVPNDEHDVAMVILRYATAVDRKDRGLLRMCFTDDFTGDFGPAGQWDGPEDAVR